MRRGGRFARAARCDRRDRGYQRRCRGRGRRRATGRADVACGTIGASGYMDMLRALLLAATEQGRAQGAAHLRHAAGHQSAGHQPGALPYHDLAGGRAAAQLRAIGGCYVFITIVSFSISLRNVEEISL